MSTRAIIQASSSLKNVRYEILGRLAQRARELEEHGHQIITLNIGDPALFGLTYDWMRARGLTEGQSEHAALVVGSGHRYLDLFGLGRAPAGKPNQSFHGTHGRMSGSGIGLFMERVLFERKQDLLPAFHFVRLPRGSLHCNANRESITQYLTVRA